jgi:hypothetical protein
MKRIRHLVTVIALAFAALVPASVAFAPAAHAASAAPAGVRVVADIGANEDVIQFTSGALAGQFGGLVTAGPYAGATFQWTNFDSAPLAHGYTCVYNWGVAGANAADANAAADAYYASHTHQTFVESFASPGGCVFYR